MIPPEIIQHRRINGHDLYRLRVIVSTLEKESLAAQQRFLAALDQLRDAEEDMQVTAELMAEIQRAEHQPTRDSIGDTGGRMDRISLPSSPQRQSA